MKVVIFFCSLLCLLSLDTAYPIYNYTLPVNETVTVYRTPIPAQYNFSFNFSEVPL